MADEKEIAEARQGEALEASRSTLGKLKKMVGIKPSKAVDVVVEVDVTHDCLSCSHSSLLHYGSEKKQCNTENCSCLELK